MNVVTRTPHDQVVDRLRAAQLEYGRVGPTDERGWTFAEVDTELDTGVDVDAGTGVAALLDEPPGSLADVLARIDALVAAPWVAQLDAASDELPEGVSAVLAARSEVGEQPVVATWVPVEPGSEPVGDGPARLDGAADAVLTAIDALVGLRVPATTAADRLAELEHPDHLFEVFAGVAALPATDSPSPDAVVQLVRSDPAFVRAAARRAQAAWVRVTDERTVVWTAARPPAPVPGAPDAAVEDVFGDALGAEHRARSTVEQGLRPGEGTLTVERTGRGVTWTVSTPDRPWVYGGWDEDWHELSTDGSEGAYDVLVGVFGEPRDPARLRALLGASTWPGDPVADLAYLLGLPTGFVEAVEDPERFRHGAERVQQLGPTAPLTAAERAALEARAPQRGTAKAVRDVVLLVLGLGLLGLGVAILTTDGAAVGLDGSPGWDVVVWIAGGVLALAGWAGLGSARSARRRFLDL